MGSAIEDAWDSMFGGDSIWGQAWDSIGGTDIWEGSGMNVGHKVKNWWADIGGAKAWENMTGMLSGESESSYDLSSSGASSACGGGACSKAADETKIPAVAQSISGDAAQAVEAQGTARKRARGIMQTYTRYDSSGIGGKSKLGE